MNSSDQLCHYYASPALLSHHNTPVQDLDMSPAKMSYSSVIKDHLPFLLNKYQICKKGKKTSKLKEAAMAKRHEKLTHLNILAHFENYKIAILFRSRIRMALILISGQKQGRSWRHSVTDSNMCKWMEVIKQLQSSLPQQSILLLITHNIPQQGQDINMEKRLTKSKPEL